MEANNLLSTDVLQLFGYFVVPGFIGVKVYDILVPLEGERRNWADELIGLIANSILNWTVVVALVYLFIIASWPPHINPKAPLNFVVRFDASSGTIRGNPILSLLAVFVLPAILAYLVYVLLASPLGSAIVRKIRLQDAVPIPTVWDPVFDSGDPYWIVFHLKSGEVLGGKYDHESFATRETKDQEVYVEEVWIVDPVTRRFVSAIPNSAGAIIKMQDCRYIELFR